MSPPLLSVVIPTWNRSDVIERAVGSVLRQTFEDFELIVVDDGSTDPTPEVMSMVSDHRVRVISTRRLGPSGARNAGADAAQGTWLAFLDSDDEARPDWLARLVASADASDADLVLAGGRFVYPDGSCSEFGPAAASGNADEVSPRFLAGCWMVRRDLFQSVGGYDPNIHFGENSELAMRLLLRRPAVKVGSTPEPLVRIHRRGTPSRRDAQVAGALAVIQRYAPERLRIPRTWAAYNTIVGTDLAARGMRKDGLVHLMAAWRSDPKAARRAARILVALSPALSRRVWSGPVADPSVLFIVLAPGVGGSVRSLGTVLEHTTGLRRVVACPAGSSTDRMLHERELVDERINIAARTGPRLVSRLLATLRVTRAAWKLRRSLAAIHANGLAELNVALLPALVAGCPLVVWVHEWEASAWSRRMAPVAKIVVPKTWYAVVSEQSRSMLVDSGMVRPARTMVVPNPIDPRDVRFDGPTDPAPEGVFRVAYLGTPAHYKGFHLLPELVEATTRHGITWTVYSGPESLSPSTFAELRRLEVTLPGKVLDVRKIFRSCDAVVVPSLHESFGRVAAEAMANGLPVVSSDLPSLRDILGDDEAGILVPPGDTAGFAEALRRLASDPDLRQCLGSAGLDRSRRFDPEPVVGQLLDLYGIERSAGDVPTRAGRT